MNRITIKHLRGLCDYLNEATGNNPQLYTNRKANVGTYYISQAYGGYCLHQMVNEGGGVNCPLTHGHVPARELYGMMNAYLRGIELKREG